MPDLKCCMTVFLWIPGGSAAGFRNGFRCFDIQRIESIFFNLLNFSERRAMKDLKKRVDQGILVPDLRILFNRADR